MGASSLPASVVLLLGVALGAVLSLASLRAAGVLSSPGAAGDARAALRPPSSSRRDAEPEAVVLAEPRWNGVLPGNIIDQQLPMVRNPHYGLHVVALGRNGSLFHRYQTGAANRSDPMVSVPMSDWICLTPPTFENTSGVELPLVFGNSPAMALNADGRIELFVGFRADSLDLWQMYQTDARDPLAWSKPRAPFCDPSMKDCERCLGESGCKSRFWSDGYTWTTSQQSLWLNPVDQKLRLTWRNFDGHLYEKVQLAPSRSEHWGTDGLQYPVFE